VKAGRLLLVTLTAAVALVSVGRASSPATASPPADTGRSLRVLAYNTAFLWADLPGLCGSIDINGTNLGGFTYQERAAEIAQAILRTDNDVVVLSEVFSDHAKSTLVALLKIAYPNYVSKISKQLTLEVSNGLLSTVLGPGSAACQEALGLSLTTTFTAADSGLMVFVKNGLEFVPFSAGTAPPYDVVTVQGRNNGAIWGLPGQIAVDTYYAVPDLGVLPLNTGECRREDCLSSKAAAMLRVRNATNGSLFNLAFSHMQAWNSTADTTVRAKQFEIMRSLIKSSLTPSEMSSQPVYVTGDLNIPGQNKSVSTSTSEWTKTFDSAGSSSKRFYACRLGPCTFSPAAPNGSFLTDSWGFETSTDDDGVTNDVDDARLDYFLHNHQLPRLSNRLCLQHVMRAYDLEDESSPLSDHLGVRADVNVKSRHCSPNDDAGVFGPRKAAFGPAGTFVVTETIRNKGGMKWFRLDKGAGWGTGSYLFKITPSAKTVGADFDVYESRDLSKPIPMFEEEPGGRGTTYSLPDPPYYIRVFMTNPSTGVPDRTRAGAFTLSVRENRGLTPSDAIALRPGHEYRYPWPALAAFDDEATQGSATFLPDTQVWYRFFTGKSAGGAFPDVSFLSENTLGLEPPLPNAPFPMKLRKESAPFPVLADDLDQAPGTGAQSNWPHDYDRDGKRDYRLDAPPLPGTGTNLRRYFLTLTRQGDALYEDIRSITTFHTTLTFIKSLRLEVLEEVTFGPADDEATFQWAYDLLGTPFCVTAGPFVCHGPVSLNDGSLWDPAHMSFHRGYARRLRPRVWEAGTELEPRTTKWIRTLSPSDGGYGGGGPFVWGAGASNADDADYWYQLHYCTHHEQAWAANCKVTD
jgi:hypothetical protein